MQAAFRFTQLHTIYIIPSFLACLYRRMHDVSLLTIYNSINITHSLCNERDTLSPSIVHLRLPKRVYTALHTVTQSCTQMCAGQIISLSACCTVMHCIEQPGLQVLPDD